MSLLFELFIIGSLELRNRFMRSATTSYWSDSQGIVRPEIIERARYLVKRLKEEQRIATCISCNACISDDNFGKVMLCCHQD